jgi:hypothetical protein
MSGAERLVPLLALLLLAPLFSCSCARKASGAEPPSAQKRYWDKDDPSLHLTILQPPTGPDYAIFIDKSDHSLTVYRAGAVVKAYVCNIRNELPDRLLENDGQTPEGIFSVYQLAKVSRPDWKRWIAFDTLEKAKAIFVRENPSGRDILEAYEKKYGAIRNDADIKKFNSRNRSTPLLRGFGIHGGGYFPGHDWTVGCAALADADVIELYDLLIRNPGGGIGTKVYIQD